MAILLSIPQLPTLDILDFIDNMIPSLPNIGSVMENNFKSFLPDFYLATSSNADTAYTQRKMHTLFHEYGHYLHRLKVNSTWWATLSDAEVPFTGPCNGYPTPGTADGDIA